MEAVPWSGRTSQSRVGFLARTRLTPRENKEFSHCERESRAAKKREVMGSENNAV
jgi:hypothetical protein